jgi:hypothetical protein
MEHQSQNQNINLQKVAILTDTIVAEKNSRRKSLLFNKRKKYTYY